MPPPAGAAVGEQPERRRAAEVGSRRGPSAAAGGQRWPLRLGASRALLPASRAPGCPPRTYFGQPNWQATLPKNACGEPAARCRYPRLFGARRRRRVVVASATAPSSLFEGQPTARGRPLTKLDGVRLLSRPAASPYHLEDVAGIAPTGLLGQKATRDPGPVLLKTSIELGPRQRWTSNGRFDAAPHLYIARLSVGASSVTPRPRYDAPQLRPAAN